MNADNIDRTRATVFLVEDDEGVRKALGRLLMAHGFNVHTFASAIAFLRTFPFASPACLVVDLKMPGMSGLTLQECLKDLGSTLPVVLISGHGDIADAAGALKGGAMAFLQKPFEEDALLEAVGRALALHLRRETELQRPDVSRHESLTPAEAEPPPWGADRQEPGERRLMGMRTSIPASSAEARGR